MIDLPDSREWRCPGCLTFYDERPNPDDIENTPWCPDDAVCICGYCRCTGDC